MQDKLRLKIPLFLTLVLLLLATGPVWAQTSEEPPDAEPCTGTLVEGTVVHVDEETAVVTIQTEDGYCTVTLRTYDHPIVSLLSWFFDDVTVESLLDALENSESDLTVSWVLVDDGFIKQVGDDIQDYHDQGIGFGVLVKLYAMAQESCTTEQNVEVCDVPVDELVEQFLGGEGMGQLFKTYGKPSKLGVGHVRKAHLDDSDDNDDEPEPTAAKNGGPKDKDKSQNPNQANSNNSNKPDHAGPKDKDDGGNPEQAGPKDKDNGNNQKDKDKKKK